MPHVRSLVSLSRLRAGTFTVLALTSFGLAALAPALPVAAETVDSAVIIQINGYSGPVTFYTTSHSLGDCNTVANKTFTTNGRTCTGYSMGTPDGMTLRLSSVPSGYQFDGFTQGYTYISSGSAACHTSYCYFNFSSGSIKAIANFSPVTPAAPTASTLSVSSRTTTSIGLSWTAANTPGGFNRYEVLRNNQLIYTTGQRSYTNGGLTCGQNYSYTVRVFDNYGRSATSVAVATNTLGCPAAATTPSTTTTSSSSSSPARRATTTSNSSSSTPVAAAVAPATTGTSSVATTNSTLGSSFEEDTETESETDQAEPKKGLTNLEKIVIGILGIGLLGWLARYFYLRQANNPDNYWS